MSLQITNLCSSEVQPSLRIMNNGRGEGFFWKADYKTCREAEAAFKRGASSKKHLVEMDYQDVKDLKV